jgi:hypothetical protein
MGARLELQIAPLFRSAELVGQRPFDVTRRGVVILDQVE